MDLDDLRIFRAVVDEGGITRAAQRLHRVQSNVTTRIKQLEADLGVELFVRAGKRLRLTPAGQSLNGYAERLLHLAQEARAAVTDGRPQGLLRLGSMESTAATHLSAVLAGFHAQHPAVNIELRTGPTARMLNDVIEGRLDCALISGPLEDERLQAIEVFREELVLIAPFAHPPIRDAAKLLPRTLLTFEAGCAYRQRLEAWLASAGVVPQRIVELSSYHTMVGCVACGMGVALIPRSLLARLPESSSVSHHRLPAQVARVKTLLIRRRDDHHPAAQALLESLKKLSSRARRTITQTLAARSP